MLSCPSRSRAPLLDATQAGTGLEKDEIKKAIEEYDSNGDAMIDLQEFMKLMKSTGAFVRALSALLALCLPAAGRLPHS